MYSILIDQDNIRQVFQRYAVADALLAKQTIESVFESFSADGVEQQTEQEVGSTRRGQFNELPGSVIRSNLARLFLNFDELYESMKGFSVQQRHEVHSLLLMLFEYLNLPSEEIQAHMEQQGFAVNSREAKSQRKPERACIDDIRNNLKRALAGENRQVTGYEKEPSLCNSASNTMSNISDETRDKIASLSAKIEAEHIASIREKINRINGTGAGTSTGVDEAKRALLSQVAEGPNLKVVNA